jgi:hypothetical protein
LTCAMLVVQSSSAVHRQKGVVRSKGMAYVIGILVAAAVLVGSAVVVLVDIARLEEILPPPVIPDKDKPKDRPREAIHSFPRDRLPQ